MRPILLAVFLTISFFNFSQIISQFNWDSNPVTNAVIGPNATGASGSATSSVNGVGGTNGLNAALPKADINMDIPASPTFDVPGIDISIDFQRDEARGDFVNRGNDFVFGIDGGNLFVNFRYDNGAGGFVQVNSGNVYTVPNDDVFRTYRFFYLPTSGYAEVRVNGTTVWSFTGVPGRALYWVAPNLRVGNLMDGSGSNKTIFDNLIIASVTFSALPIELLSFTATKENNTTNIEWVTASELNNDYFLIEKSEDGKNFQTISKIKGAGNSSHQLSYNEFDKSPYNGINYYRLKQVDFDGEFSYSKIVSLDFRKEESVRIFPNPSSNGIFTIEGDKKDFSLIKVYNSIGQEMILEPYFFDNSIQIDLSNFHSGIYFVQFQSKTYKIIYQ